MEVEETQYHTLALRDAVPGIGVTLPYTTAMET